MQRHRYLHEAFRVACLLQLHTSVMCIPPMSFTVRMLVRQALSLLETITEQDIPGYCSAHWVLFMTGLCASGEGHEPGKPSDRERVKTLYVDMLDQFGFHNVPRSKRIVNAVWDRNEQGKAFVDWLDIVAEYDWDLFLV
jgi:transcriptional activator protein UGA3